MIKILSVSFCLLCSILVHAQLSTWAWASSGDNQNNSGRSVAKGIAQDKFGNIYVVGGYAGSIVFDTSSFTANGNVSIYLLKYNSSGALLWARAVENANSVVAQSVAVDSNGDAYIAGAFLGSAVFDTVTLTSNGANDIFLAKFGSDGQVIWAKSFGTTFEDNLQSGLAVDSRNNILINGTFATGTGSNATITFDGFSITSKGRPNIYLVKFDSDGRAIWAKRAGDAPSTYGYSLATDRDDNIYMVGYFLSAQAHFGNITVNSNNIGNITGTAFLVKYDSAGTPIWAHAFGGKRTVGDNDYGSIQGTLVTTDSSGNVFVGGDYSDCAMVVGSSVLQPTSYDIGTYDMWFAKFSPGGNYIWAKKAGSMEPDYLRGLTVDKLGNVYITGEHGEACVFDGDTAFLPVTGSSTSQMFVCKYNKDGNLQWLNSLGGDDNSVGCQLIVDSVGNAIMVGGFVAQALRFGSTVLFNGGNINGFIAKTGVPATTASVNPLLDNVRIFPNPASNEVIIQTANPGMFTDYTLVDALGRKMASGQIAPLQSQRISLPSIPDGLYYLNISGKVVVSNKIQIIH
jgi:hypothetical protein